MHPDPGDKILMVVHASNILKEHLDGLGGLTLSEHQSLHSGFSGPWLVHSKHMGME